MDEDQYASSLGCALLLALFVGGIWLFFGFDKPDLFTEKTTLKIYSLKCSSQFKNDKCPGVLSPGEVVEFRINRSGKEVLLRFLRTPDRPAKISPTKIGKYSNCDIWDAENWSCEGWASPKIVNGMPPPNARIQGDIKIVRGWVYRLHKTASWVGLEIGS